jgi:hypothetical protein
MGMNGGMKMISQDGQRVFVREQHEEQTSLLLEALKSVEKVEIVSTGSAFSLIVRATFNERLNLFRDDLIGEDDALMVGDARRLPNTGKPIREIILKFILVSSAMTQYTYDNVNDKCSMLQMDVNNEYTQQQLAFDATNVHIPLCPDVVANVLFPTREKFDEIFTMPKNQQYVKCRVFQKLRNYFSLQFKPQVAMIAMESIPATYDTLKGLKKRGISLESIEQIEQVCAMYVVLFYTCKLIALDAHLSNWLVDIRKPEPLRFKLIDFGMCISVTNEKLINTIVSNYFKKYSDQLPAYLRLMGANAGDSPSDVMIRAIQSVHVINFPIISWIHKTLVISMLIDGFYNVYHSSRKTTCQMSKVLNLVYDNACVSMTNILQTLSLDLPTYLRSQSSENAARMIQKLNNMSSYMERYYMLRARNLHDFDAEPIATPDMSDVLDASDASDAMPLPRYGGKKTRKMKKPRNANKSKIRRGRSRRMH